MFFVKRIDYYYGINPINIKEEYIMKEKLKDKKVQAGITIATVVAGAVSGLVFKKVKDKRRERRLLQELEDSSFDGLDI